MSVRLEHIPSVAAVGLRGPALCGIWARYMTADHALIRRLAAESIARENVAHLCARCRRAFRDTPKRS
jgi:hypothetical protein